MTQILTAEDVKSMSIEDINEAVRQGLSYDEYRWQEEQNIRITEPFRAEGLHKVLYQCPHCGSEHDMASEGAQIFCRCCGKRWEMDELGRLHALEGETEFSHIPDWHGSGPRCASRFWTEPTILRMKWMCIPCPGA